MVFISTDVTHCIIVHVFDVRLYKRGKHVQRHKNSPLYAHFKRLKVGAKSTLFLRQKFPKAWEMLLEQTEAELQE